ELDAFEILHRENAGGGELGIRAGNVDRGIGGEEVGELLQVAEFAAEIELTAKDALELGHGGAGAIVGKLGDALGPTGEDGEDIEVAADRFFDAGVANFDGNPVAAF